MAFSTRSSHLEQVNWAIAWGGWVAELEYLDMRDWYVNQVALRRQYDKQQKRSA